MRRLTAFWTMGAALLCGTLGLSGTARAAEASKEGIEFFEKNIRPVLVEQCYKCHSVEAKNSKKLKAKFYADSWEGLSKGGDSGTPGIVPGDPDKSTLIKGIRFEYTGDEESLNMPPKNKADGKGGKLADDVIKNFEKWVKMGAPYPKDFEKPKTADAGKGTTPQANAAEVGAKAHWAFAPPRAPSLPVVTNGAWAQNEIDQFVLAKLEAKGLTPSPSADRRTLVRRLTFDLTGLPPTPAEVDAFANDASTDAYGKLVDRLLASPAYGERWARHWLDVARYADTKGYVGQEERRYPYAYTYRDWVINAFNADLPYDQFLIQQIAADQLDLKGDPRPLAAMGFLTVGRRFINNQVDIIDDRIDVVTRGTMGLTVTCSRCHDHKFDPIPTKDYYSLYGIFNSSTEPKVLPLLVTAEETASTPASLAFQTELKAREAAVDTFVESGKADLLTSGRAPKAIADYLMALEARGPKIKGSDLSSALAASWRQYLANAAKAKDPIFAAWRMYSQIPDDRFEQDVRAVTQRILARADAETKSIHPLVAELFKDKPPKELREAADRYGELLARFDKPEPLEDPQAEALRLVLYGPASPYAFAPGESTRELVRSRRDLREKLQSLMDKVTEWEISGPNAPPRAMVMNDLPQPQDSPIFVRGNPGNTGPVAPRQFLECLSPNGRTPFTQGSGRLQLAQAIASKDNPLTARVFVNRVWLRHFGKGIVRTPSDFGVRCDPPSHSELLDYLAVRFMDEGWSVKRLHKLILTSATYQQASDDKPAASAIDPENHLLWRQNRQRIEFEVIRDALLAAAGQLNPTMFGRSVDLTQPEETRRTVYGFIDRQNLPGLFRAFDFASPDTHSPQRFSTTVPQQALFFMNSPFVQRQARAIVRRPEFATAADPAEKVDALHWILFGRAATADDVELAEQFMESEAQVPVPAKSPTPTSAAWQYGYGQIDESAGRVTSFRALKHQGAKGWQGGPTLPDPHTGFVSLSSTGGRPGDAAHSAIRRWTAPAAGIVEITGTLRHSSPDGDGVRGWIVSSSGGVLKTWAVHKKTVPANVTGISVAAGETIDFVVDSGADTDKDNFVWAPKLVLTGQAVPGKRIEFDATKDYDSDVGPPAPPLSAWEKYAHVLLLSNEFVFVD